MMIATEYCNRHEVERLLIERLNLLLIKRDNIVASAVHELRTPLQNIMLALESIELDSVDGQNAQRLLAARAAATDLDELVENFMEISSLNAAESVLKVDRFDVHEVINLVCRSFIEPSQSRQLDYHFNIDPSVPVYAWGDSIRVKQILYNILGNAFKYTKTGHVSVLVDTPNVLNMTGDIAADSSESPDLISGTDSSMSSDAGSVYTQWIVISVEDSGIGIASEQLPQLFEPFSTVGPASSISRGLGLAICKRLLELMDGKIWWIRTLVKARPSTSICH